MLYGYAVKDVLNRFLIKIIKKKYLDSNSGHISLRLAFLFLPV